MSTGKTDNPTSYLGIYNDTACYSNYEAEAVTTLDHHFLSSIKTRVEQYVVYAHNCLLTKEFMVKHPIVFKKIPKDITRFQIVGIRICRIGG